MENDPVGATIGRPIICRDRRPRRSEKGCSEGYLCPPENICRGRHLWRPVKVGASIARPSYPMHRRCHYHSLALLRGRGGSSQNWRRGSEITKTKIISHINRPHTFYLSLFIYYYFIFIYLGAACFTSFVHEFAHQSTQNCTSSAKSCTSFFCGRS